MHAATEQHEVQAFAPKWPEVAKLQPEQARFIDDRPTDTLFVAFFGDARPAASAPRDSGDRDYFSLRVDVATDEVVGLQIEGFLSYAVVQHPGLVDAPAEAELVGIDAAEVRRHLPPGSPGRSDRAGLIEQMLRVAAVEGGAGPAVKRCRPSMRDHPDSLPSPIRVIGRAPPHLPQTHSPLPRTGRGVGGEG